MSSVPDPGFDQRIADWLEEDPDHAPTNVLETVVAAVPSIPQRRVWRLPKRSSTMLRLSFVAVAIVAFGSAFLVLPRGQDSSGVGPGLSPSAAPSIAESVGPSPSTMSIGEYRAARNSICSASSGVLEPLKLRFLGTFDNSLTDAQVADWASGLDEFVTGYDALISQLSALQPPPELALAHSLNVLDLEEQRVLIRRVALELRYRQWSAARTDDAATDPISRRLFGFESQNAFSNCP
jgi:hypothetical protein